MTKNILVIGDPHARPGVSNARFSILGKFIKDKQPDIVVCIGDLADMGSLCTYDRGTYHSEGRRYTKDIEAANDALYRVHHEIKGMKNKPKMYITLGNHEYRIHRASVETPELYGHLTMEDLQFDEYGWKVIPFLRPLVLQGITFQHYYTRGNLGRPMEDERSVLRKQHISCVYGHNHFFQYYCELNGWRKKVFSMGAGCFDVGKHSYTREQERWWSGLIMLYEAENGYATPALWDMKYLKRKYL